MIGPKAIAEAVREGILRAAWELRPDVRLAMESALRSERSPRGRNVIGQMLENARIAERDRAPLCQDTGAVWVWVELGEAEILGVPLQAAVDAAVAAAYKEG
ncbi:MAG: fumarate hydratase, partial [Actinobacteria bacterium]|nr:fumarate hydratase [Actinomycetota bacterium]